MTYYRKNPIYIDPILIQKTFYHDPATGKIFHRPRTEPIGDRYVDIDKFNKSRAHKEAFTTKSTPGYLCGSFCAKILLAHRVIWVLEHGEWPDCIDHVNGDRTDNRISNLRSVSHLENMRNRKLSAKNEVGYPGVYRMDWGWIVKVRAEGKSKYVGSYHSVEEAIDARKAAEIEYGIKTITRMK